VVDRVGDYRLPNTEGHVGIKMETCLNSHFLCSGQRPKFLCSNAGDVFRMPTSFVVDIVRSCLHFNPYPANVENTVSS